LKKEDDIVAINSGLSDFLTGMSLEKTTFVVANAGQRLSGTQPVCAQLWVQEDRRMTATSTSLSEMLDSKEEVLLSRMSDALTWRHILDLKYYKRPGLRVVRYPGLLTRLSLVLSTGNLGMDPEEDPWPAYQAILNLPDTWHDSCRPIILPESDTRSTQWEEINRKIEERMEEMKAIAGYRLVLEDGSEICSSESTAEYSERSRQSIT
jgi:hypothetical protein